MTATRRIIVETRPTVTLEKPNCLANVAMNGTIGAVAEEKKTDDVISRLEPYIGIVNVFTRTVKQNMCLHRKQFTID